MLDTLLVKGFGPPQCFQLFIEVQVDQVQMVQRWVVNSQRLKKGKTMYIIHNYTRRPSSGNLNSKLPTDSAQPPDLRSPWAELWGDTAPTGPALQKVLCKIYNLSWGLLPNTQEPAEPTQSGFTVYSSTHCWTSQDKVQWGRAVCLLWADSYTDICYRLTHIWPSNANTLPL